VKGDHPDYSAKKIKEALATANYGAVDVDTTLVYRELSRLKLSTKEKRFAYVKRTKEEKVNRELPSS